METLNLNPFKDYKLEAPQKKEKEVNPVRELVVFYYETTGHSKEPKTFYRGRYGWGKLAKEAKTLLEHCGGKLEDAMWCIDQMKYRAEKGRFDWSIITCLKHELK